MDKLDYIIKNSLMEDIPIPLTYDTMVKNTLSNITKPRNTLSEKIFKIIVSILTTILSMTGICLAASGIYNYVLDIPQGQVSSNGLGSIDTEGKEKLLNSDMEWDKENAFYYKIIENIDVYNKYKNKVNELPNLENDDFENNCLLIITSTLPRNPDEKNLKIVDINANDQTTFITLKQIDNSNNNKINNIIYSIIPKELLRENIKIIIQHFNIYLPEFESIDNLPTNYSINDAIKDGCIVVEKGILKSNNLNRLNNLIRVANEDGESYVRIYNKVVDNEIKIIDIIYKDGLYYMNSCNISSLDRKIQYNSFETIHKGTTGNMVIYSGMTKLYDSQISRGIPIIILSNV